MHPPPKALSFPVVRNGYPSVRPLIMFDIRPLRHILRYSISFYL